MTKPLITGGTTVAELTEMLRERGVDKIHLVRWGAAWGGDMRFAEGSRRVSAKEWGTLAGALSALLDELPEVPRG